MKLGIAIPALDEQDNIESITQRSQEARQHIHDHSSVTAAEITVVSDGSTDRTLFITRCIECMLGLVRERILYWQQLRKP